MFDTVTAFATLLIYLGEIKTTSEIKALWQNSPASSPFSWMPWESSALVGAGVVGTDPDTIHLSSG